LTIVRFSTLRFVSRHATFLPGATGNTACQLTSEKKVMTMQVTEVDIAFVRPKDGLIAFASVVLDNQIYLSGIAIHQKLVGTGFRLTYPTRKVGDTQFDLFHPIRRPIGLAIERAIVEKVKDVLSKRDAGHDRADA
jgi:stage V sporulation protein G